MKKYIFRFPFLFFVWLLIACDGGYEHSDHSDNSSDTLQLTISKKSFSKLEDIRKRALKKGILITGKKDMVPATIKWEGKEHPIRIRLKGDWTDHLKGNKWSFRIEVLDGETWKNMRIFSIQSPETRHFMDEWLAHEAAKKENVLTTDYGFVPVMINGTYYGIYAWEEHFTPELLANHARNAGLIFKFDEDALWKIRAKNHKEDLPWPAVFEAARIDVFDSKNQLTTASMWAQFDLGQKMLNSYRFGVLNVAESFNTDRLAAYLALNDVFRAYHSLIWHNQRFYMDPANGRLEPILYDAFTENGSYDEIRQPFMAYHFRENDYINRKAIYLYGALNDPVVFDAYAEKLSLFSNESYLKNLVDNLQTTATRYEAMIRTEYPEYRFDPSFLSVNAKNIRANLAVLKDGSTGQGSSPPSKTVRHLPDTVVMPITGLAAAGYWFEDTLWVTNYFHLPVHIEDVDGKSPEKVLQLAAYRTFTPPEFKWLLYPKKVKRLRYMVEGIDSLFEVKVKKQPPPLSRR